ncbi:MAG: hypothetical protein DMF84_28370 [Acidobacteria bacterium]|nr:MAG: hypothetical protein DMF84_28370 [Acidobacteriota bacterium]
MVLFNRKARGPNLAPVADRFRDISISYSDQFIQDELELTPTRSYDPNLDPVTYRWLDASGADVVAGSPFAAAHRARTTSRSWCATIAAPKAGARQR